MAIIRRWAITWDGVNPSPGTYEAAYLTTNAWLAARPSAVNLVTADEQWIVEIFPGYEANGLDIQTARLDMYYLDWVGNRATDNYIIFRAALGGEYVYPQNTRDARLGFATYNDEIMRMALSMPYDIVDLHLQTQGGMYNTQLAPPGQTVSTRCFMDTLGVSVGVKNSTLFDCVIKSQVIDNYAYYRADMERCTIYDSGTTARLITESIVNNTAVFTTSTPCFALGGNTGSNNASSDGTALSEGVGTIVNFTMSEFVQPDGSDMHIVPGSQFEGAGANQWDGSGTQADIDRDLYPQTGDWNIGADYIPGGVPTPQTNSLFLGQDF